MKLQGRVRAILGETVVWVLPLPPASKIRCVRGEVVTEIDTPEVRRPECYPSHLWTEGDDLLWRDDGPTARIRPDGSRIEDDAREIAFAQTDDGRQVGMAPHPDGRVPIDVRDGRAIAPLVHRNDLGTVALVGDEIWRLDDDDALVRAGARVLLDTPIRSMWYALAGGADALFVRHGRWIHRVEATGRTLQLATPTQHSRPSAGTLFVDGDWVVWSEETEVVLGVEGQPPVETRIVAVPATGGQPRVLARRVAPQTLQLVDVYRGRALVVEVRIETIETARLIRVVHHPEALTILDLEPSAGVETGATTEPVATAEEAGTPRASLHDPISRMPMRAEVVGLLAKLGVATVAELRERIWDLEPQLRASSDATFVEARYALERFAAHVEQAGTARSLPLRPIDPSYLRPASALSLPSATARAIGKSAPTLADIVTRTEAHWRKTNGMGKKTVDALTAAVTAGGLELGKRWTDLAGAEEK